MALTLAGGQHMSKKTRRTCMQPAVHSVTVPKSKLEALSCSEGQTAGSAEMPRALLGRMCSMHKGRVYMAGSRVSVRFAEAVVVAARGLLALGAAVLHCTTSTGYNNLMEGEATRPRSPAFSEGQQLAGARGGGES